VGNSWQDPNKDEAGGGTWHKVANPGTGWLASKTSWSGAGSFVTAGYYLEVDFSASVPAGTKAVQATLYVVTQAGDVYQRRPVDSNISDTPVASQEYSQLVATAIGGKQVELWLDTAGKVRLTVADVNTNLYVSYPSRYMI
jgi:hypothetical protein